MEGEKIADAKALEPEVKTVPQDTTTVDLGNVVKEDIVQKWMTETEEGIKFAQSLADKRVTQAIKTYKENKFEEEVKTRVESEYRRLHPEETHEQKRLREVESKIAEGERRARKAEIGKVAYQHANAIGIDKADDLLDYFVGDSEEETRMRLDKFKEYIKYREEIKVNQVLATNTKAPSGGDDERPSVFGNWDELRKYMKNHPEAMSDPEFVKAYERLAKGA